MRIARLSYADLLALVVLVDDAEKRRGAATDARAVRWLAKRELRKRERVTAKANAIYRGRP